MPKNRISDYAHRHWKGLVSAGVILASAVGGGYALIVEPAKAAPVVVSIQAPPTPAAPLTAADAAGLREDIGYLRVDIREERKAREDLTKQMGEFRTELGGRISKLEGFNEANKSAPRERR